MNAPDPMIEPGTIRLNVADAARARAFYERTIGLRSIADDADALRLGTNGTPLVELIEAHDAPRRPPHTTGLFHLAIVLEGHRELAQALRRIAGSGWPLAGASDHLVSEALYLNDPEGNGIELYCDRPRADWRYVDGQLEMSTLPLDLDALAADAGDSDFESVGSEARIGHLHLNVADLAEAEAFYCGLLGFEVTVRGYPGALFVSTGGYHHHLGFNTWSGRGAPSPPGGALGLNRFELVVNDPLELDRIERRLTETGIDAQRAEGGFRVADPSANRLLLTSR